MSKTSIENKEKKLKSKALKASEANSAKKEPKQKSALSGIPNFGKCVTCAYFPKKANGQTQPCKVLKAYVARKAEHPECYKCKISD